MTEMTALRQLDSQVDRQRALDGGQDEVAGRAASAGQGPRRYPVPTGTGGSPTPTSRTPGSSPVTS
jgi:hypothetical protein